MSPIANDTWQKAFKRANDLMLSGQNAARVALGQIQLEFPDIAAITNEANKVCIAQVAQCRKTFEKAVADIFLGMSKHNTIIK